MHICCQPQVGEQAFGLVRTMFFGQGKEIVPQQYTSPERCQKKKLPFKAEAFKAEVHMVMHFTMVAHACISRIMSDKHVVPDMDDVIKICLDTMVEMDR